MGIRAILLILIIGEQLRAGRASAPALVFKGNTFELSGPCQCGTCVSAQAPAVGMRGRSRCDFDAGLPKFCGGFFGSGRSRSDCIACESPFGSPRHFVAPQANAPLRSPFSRRIPHRNCMLCSTNCAFRFLWPIQKDSILYRRSGIRTSSLAVGPTVPIACSAQVRQESRRA